MLEIIKEIKEIIAIIIPLIVGLCYLILKVTRNSKLKNIAEQFIKIEKVIKEFMCNAELFINFSGSDKKEWVKTKVNQFCIENNIFYKEDIVDDLIEQFIGLSKTVNKREKEEGVKLL